MAHGAEPTGEIVRTINEHLRNVFEEGELAPAATIRKFRMVRREGAREVAREIEHYDDSQRSDVVTFFQTIQNTLHFAATGMTAAELIAGRADQQQPNMGLTSWKGGVVRKDDVTVAKNCLKQDEIDEFNRIVTMWHDFADDQARRRKQVFLSDWQAKLDEFLRFNERNVLAGKGHVSKAAADARAEAGYERFAERRRALLEAEAERAQQQALEDAARDLPAPGNKPGRKGKGRTA